MDSDGVLLDSDSEWADKEAEALPFEHGMGIKTE